MGQGGARAGLVNTYPGCVHRVPWQCRCGSTPHNRRRLGRWYADQGKQTTIAITLVGRQVRSVKQETGERHAAEVEALLAIAEDLESGLRCSIGLGRSLGGLEDGVPNANALVVDRLGTDRMIICCQTLCSKQRPL